MKCREGRLGASLVRVGGLASQMATEFRACISRIVLVVMVLEGIVTEVVLVGDPANEVWQVRLFERIHHVVIEMS